MHSDHNLTRCGSCKLDITNRILNAQEYILTIISYRMLSFGNQKKRKTVPYPKNFDYRYGDAIFMS